MGMRETIKNFNQQFAYEPKIVSTGKFKKFNKFIIAGMGGSNLAVDLLKIRDPLIDAIAHRDYGLPAMPKSEIASRLFIANSYSGNTEETVNALRKALEAGFSSMVIATGGKLIKMAKKHNLPYILMPATGIQPRSALGYNLLAILKVMGREDLLAEMRALERTLEPSNFEVAGRILAKKIKNHVPVVYASLKNAGLAYNWKIKFNETGKIPAFYNVLSELNHNEMTGFDVGDSTRELSRPFYFLILRDASDHPQIQKRITVLAKLYRDRGLKVEVLKFKSRDIFHKIFSSLLLADWTAYYIAEGYGLEAEQVPMVEEFKKLIA